MKNKYSHGSLRRYFKYFVFRHVFLSEQVFIAQLVEHRNGIAEVTDSNPVEALIFFQASSFQLLKLKN